MTVMVRRVSWLMLLLWCGGPVIAQSARPVPRGRPAMTRIVLVKDGEPHAVIAAPRDDVHRNAAREIQQAVLKATGARLPIIDDAEAEKRFADQNLVVIGNLMTNRVAERLYRNYYVNADARFPGKGRYELRTVHDPEGLGTGMVFCGGSDAAGIQASVSRLLAHVKPGRDLVLPHVVEVEYGGTPGLPTDEQVKDRIDKMAGNGPFPPSGFIAEEGMKYYWTGNPEYLKACKAAIPMLLAGLEGSGPAQGSGLTPQTVQGPFKVLLDIQWMPMVWDQIEEAPIFTDDDRAAMCGYLLRLLELSPQLHTLDAGEKRDAPPWFQYTMSGGHAASLYLARFCPDLELPRTVQQRIGQYYSLQNDFWKLVFDSSWYIHQYFNWYMVWFLTTNDQSYMEMGHLASLCDYIMTAIITNQPYGVVFGDGGGGPGTTANLLSLGAWYYQDGRYEWFRRFLGGSWKFDWNLGHTYATGIEPKKPDDILGVKVIRAEDWVYAAGLGEVAPRQWIGPWVTETNPPLMPPRERAYDKISFRSDIDKDATFLLLDGLSGFGMAHADANNIVQLWDKGRQWLQVAGYMVYELSEHNMVVVTRNGEGGTKTVPMLADLELHADMDGFGAVRSTLHNYNGTEWARNILWAKDRYFLVVDELTAVVPGDYVQQGWWKSGGTLEGRRLSSKGKELHWQQVSLDDSSLSQTRSRHNASQLR